MTGKDKVVKCCGAIEAEVELTEHPAAAEWVGSLGSRDNSQASPQKKGVLLCWVISHSWLTWVR